uniref:Uncharacterized protein n=1 Tax=Panagrolaimus sp. JU765 TaxID=591449 RepID=A0AC34QHT6_9BILA
MRSVACFFLLYFHLILATRWQRDVDFDLESYAEPVRLPQVDDLSETPALNGKNENLTPPKDYMDEIIDEVVKAQTKIPVFHPKGKKVHLPWQIIKLPTE